jgi:hypothetical protein
VSLPLRPLRPLCEIILFSHARSLRSLEPTEITEKRLSFSFLHKKCRFLCGLCVLCVRKFFSLTPTPYGRLSPQRSQRKDLSFLSYTKVSFPLRSLLPRCEKFLYPHAHSLRSLEPTEITEKRSKFSFLHKSVVSSAASASSV